MHFSEIGSEVTPEKLWQQTAGALERGDFTLLEDLLSHTNSSIIDLLRKNDASSELAAEAFTWACFVGRTGDAEELLDQGVDPSAGTKTGLAGFHWAANRGNLETVRMLIKRGAPLEQLNMYGGTVLGCALWSAVFEPRDTHGAITEELINAGAVIEPGSLDWWKQQDVSSDETRQQVAQALRRKE